MSATPRKGRTFVIYNRKGGPGKTTLAINLAIFLQSQGIPVLLLDLDDQGDSTTFFSRRKSQYPEAAVMECRTATRPEEVEALLQAAVADGIDVVVDCPPQDIDTVKAACEMADAMVVPLVPGGNDALAIGRVVRFHSLLPSKPPLLAVINKFRARQNADKSLESFLKGAGIFHLIGHLSQNNAYRDAIDEHLAVWEYSPKLPAAQEASLVATMIHRAVDGR